MDDLQRKQIYRRALSTEAGRAMIADIAAHVGVQAARVPYDNEGRVDAVELARREGARGLVLEVMAHASIELAFEFPPLAVEAARSNTIDTENSA